MGCGASKAVPVAENNAPVAAPKKVVVETAAAPTAAASTSSPAAPAAAPADKANLSISGVKVSSSSTAAAGGGPRPSNSSSTAAPQTPESDSDSMREMSAVSTRSAPTVLQRPSSRGGSAYDLQFEESEAIPKRMPRRLEQLRSDKQKRKKEQSLEELQRKYEAAEKRKREYESKIKAKMADEIEKSERILAMKNSGEGGKEPISDKENKALENREAHLKSLRDKLRAKEEHAQKVRDNKRAQESSAN